MDAFQEQIIQAVEVATKPLLEKITTLEQKFDILSLRKEDELIPLKEAANILGKHPNTLRNWVEAGEIESVRRGRSIFFRPSELFTNNPDK